MNYNTHEMEEYLDFLCTAEKEIEKTIEDYKKLGFIVDQETSDKKIKLSKTALNNDKKTANVNRVLITPNDEFDFAYFHSINDKNNPVDERIPMTPFHIFTATFPNLLLSELSASELKQIEKEPVNLIAESTSEPING